MGDGLRSFKGLGASDFGGQLGRRMAGGEVSVGRPWRRVVLFKEAEEGRKERGGREQESKGGYAGTCLRA
jgi:hypothetical protein